MTDFHKALQHVLRWEGGYVNHKEDSGGETYCGISRVFWPNWSGWPIVTGLLAEGYPPEADDPELMPHVMAFYRENFWHPLRAQQIISQSIATYLLDTALPLGVRKASILLQEAVNGATPNWIKPDGFIGPVTIGAVNRANEEALLRVFRELRIAYHENRVKEKPSQAVFLNGWINRARAEL